MADCPKRSMLLIGITLTLLSACSILERNSNSEFISPTKTLSPCYSRARFGDPADSPYVLPFPVGRSYKISQTYCFPDGSHHIQLAYDFDIPIGADISAARSGTVIEIRDGTPDTSDPTYNNKHNYVLTEHNDGTVAFYAHLKLNGIFVKVGDSVIQGQVIADSGNSGFTGFRPHLHFGVYQFYPLREAYDVPVNFSNTDGRLDERGGLIRWQFYKALEYE